MLDKGFIQNGGLGVVYILIRSIEQIEQLYLILATDIKISNFKVLINKINRFHRSEFEWCFISFSIYAELG